MIDPRAALDRIDLILATTPIPGATRETHVAIVQDIAALRLVVDAWERSQDEAKTKVEPVV